MMVRQFGINDKNQLLRGDNMFLDYILPAYVCFSFAIFIIFGVLVLDDALELSFKNIFAFQFDICEGLGDKLNIVGISIVVIIVTLVFFGTSMMNFILLLFVWIIRTIWKLFCLAFKKR